jgi:TolB-like protein/DNA-binding SARP family transcriptional activator
MVVFHMEGLILVVESIMRLKRDRTGTRFGKGSGKSREFSDLRRSGTLAPQRIPGDPPMVGIRVLGPFEAKQEDGAMIAIAGRKDRALLAFLALGAETDHSRERLAGLFWGGSDESRARDSLKHALARLRGGLGLAFDDALRACRATVRLDAGVVRLDAGEFEDLAADGTATGLERALALYRGDFLEGAAPVDAGVEDWVLTERRRFRRLAEDCAGRLVAVHWQSGDLDAGELAARTHLRLDPLNEPACRMLMLAKASAGDAARALRIYADLRARLREELGVAPDSETAALHDRIRSGRNAGSLRLRYGGPADRVEERAGGPSSLPSIAILAFERIGSDGPGADYFADGIIEEITAALSRVRGLVVIARNSSFRFRGGSGDGAEIGRALGARYLLRGSVRRDDGQVRISAALIEAEAGTVIWSESFQGAAKGVFELQDQIASRVVGALLPKVERAEIARAFRKPTESLDAYDFFLRGLASMHRWTAEASAEAIGLFMKAADLDPEFATAYGMAVRCYSQRKACGWVRERNAETAEAARLARLAVEAGPDDALALATAGIGFGFVIGDPARGARLIRRALEINPNLSLAWLFGGWVEVWLGRHESAIAYVERAVRLSPQDPQFAMMQAATACAHFFAGRDREAVDLAERAVVLQPNYWIAWCVLAASRASAGDPEGARSALARVMEIDRGLRLSNLPAAFPISEPTDIRKWTAALRLAGLPD